jgi:insulysin
MKIIFFLFLPLLGYAYTTPIEEKALLPVLSHTFAERQTAKIQLENGLRAYLISDPNTDKSSAALAIKTGSWEDPKDAPGTAHFLEHMLFLGNKKYPEESEYEGFISEHGGQYNAFTSNDFTGYVFTVNNSAFPEALDRFSNFFKEPLFNPSGVDRELQAIDQEYAKNLENDEVREYFIFKELAMPGHPNAAFSMGNRESLQKVSQESLKHWYNTHYSANLMQVEVISPLPLDTLKELVVKDFGEVPNANLVPSMPTIPTISDASKGHMVYVEPIKDIRRLVLAWELPFKFAAMRDSKPEMIICYILGHEGTNSLLAQLKKEKLAEGITCNTEKVGGNSFILSLQIDLTDLGVKEVNQVILRCFEAIAAIKKNGIPDHLVEELKTMTKLNYEYQSREDPFEHIIKEAMLLPNESMETYPEQTLVFQKYDPEATLELLQFLTPENAIFELMAPKSLTGVPFESKEKWLGILYTIKAIPEEDLNSWKQAQPNPNIGLPPLNPYLPVNLKLLSSAHSKTSSFSFPHPSLIIDNGNGKIYFAQDTFYSSPRINWSFEIKTPTIDPANVESVVMADLFIKMINDQLNAYTYPASMAGLNFSLADAHNGFKINIDGYNDKAQSLFLDLLKEIKTFKPREQKFKSFKDLLLSKQKAAAIKKISFDQFQDFFHNLLEKSYVQGMMYGNMNQENAQTTASQLIQILASEPYPKEDHIKEEVIVLPQNEGPFIIEAKSKVQGNAAVLAIELDPYSFKERAAQQILMLAIKEPFFSTLRTQQQTGYIVLSNAEELEQHLFDTFSVQSNTHEGRELLFRFELFIEDFLQEISKSKVPQERFENLKMALLTTLKQPPQNINEMSELLYKMAFFYNGDFDWIAKRIKGLEELSYEEFLEHAYQTLGKENRRRLATFVTGSPQDNLQYRKLNGTGALRKLSTYEPAP